MKQVLCRFPTRKDTSSTEMGQLAKQKRAKMKKFRSKTDGINWVFFKNPKISRNFSGLLVDSDDSWLDIWMHLSCGAFGEAPMANELRLSRRVLPEFCAHFDATQTFAS